MAHILDESKPRPGLCTWSVAVDGCMSPVPVQDARLQENDREMLTLTDSGGKVVFRAAWGRVQYLRRHDPKPGPPESANSPVLTLPLVMATEGHYRIVRMGAGFTEVFPGLEAAIFLPPDDEGKIIAHFRLTPKDGQGNG